MGRPSYETVILSDLHLGSETARAEEALETLQGISFRRLILLGDIFADLNFRRLKKEHWRFLSYIRKLSNPKRGVEVVWVEGNHDLGLTDVMSHLVGVPVYQEYIWQQGGRRNLAVHGHQFDSFVWRDRSCLCGFACYLFLLIQKLDARGQRFARLLDRLETRWLRLSEKVAQGALVRARSVGAQQVFCGHTHQPARLERDGVSYFNAGAWTNECPTFITIADEEVTIHEYQSRIGDRHSGEERGEAVAAFAGFPGESGLLTDAGYAGVYR
jgi:UDP-2,3-diacylglucosamine pyrophosphatase LpxH